MMIMVAIPTYWEVGFLRIGYNSFLDDNSRFLIHNVHIHIPGSSIYPTAVLVLLCGRICGLLLLCVLKDLNKSFYYKSTINLSLSKGWLKNYSSVSH